VFGKPRSGARGLPNASSPRCAPTSQYVETGATASEAARAVSDDRNQRVPCRTVDREPHVAAHVREKGRGGPDECESCHEVAPCGWQNLLRRSFNIQDYFAQAEVVEIEVNLRTERAGAGRIEDALKLFGSAGRDVERDVALQTEVAVGPSAIPRADNADRMPGGIVQREVNRVRLCPLRVRPKLGPGQAASVPLGIRLQGRPTPCGLARVPDVTRVVSAESPGTSAQRWRPPGLSLCT